MNTTRRTFLFAAAAGLGTATLAACGATESTPAGSGGGGGDIPEEILIAGLWATSGASAAYGEWYNNASNLAVKQINDEGGLNGKTRIRLTIEDTQAQPEPAVTAFQRLLGQDVRFVESAFSSQTLALMPIAAQRKIPVMNGGAQSPLLGETGDYLFNTIPLIYKESEALAKYLHSEGMTTAAVIHTSDDGGVAAYEAFREAFEAAGGTVAAVESGEYQGTDFRSQLTKLKTSDADVLIVGAFGLDSNNIISQTREVGWDVQLANTSWVAIPEVLANKGAEGLIHTSIPFTPTEEFVAAYQEEYGEQPTSGYIGNYYDGIMVFAQGYERASNNGEIDPDGEAIMAAIKEIGTFESCYGSELRFDENLVAERPIGVSRITGGASEILTDQV